jgi:hypothetical protein
VRAAIRQEPYLGFSTCDVFRAGKGELWSATATSGIEAVTFPNVQWPRAAWWTVALSPLNSLAASLGAFALGVVAPWLWLW